MEFSSISVNSDRVASTCALPGDDEAVEWIGEADLVDAGDAIGAGNDGWWKPDPAGAHAAAMGVIEWLSAKERMLIADQYRLMAQIVREAETIPEHWVGPDPTLDPDWRDVRGRGVGAIGRDRQELAVRAAVADAAVRLRMAETTIRRRAAHAETLRERCPQLWSKFLAGQVSESNAVTTAQLVATLPDDSGSWTAFDEQVLVLAVRLTPDTFRTAARSIRERVRAEGLPHTDRIPTRLVLHRRGRRYWIRTSAPAAPSSATRRVRRSEGDSWSGRCRSGR